MSTTRRSALIAAVVTVVVTTVTSSASAAFSDTAAGTVGISTGSVAAPETVTPNGWCGFFVYYGSVSWTASATTRGVTGYRVLAHCDNGATQRVAQTDAGTLSVRYSMGRGNLRDGPRISVTTLTSYGWTAESPRSAPLTC